MKTRIVPVLLALGALLAPPCATAAAAGNEEMALGVACFGRNEYPEAARHLRLAVAQAPDLAQAHLYLGAASFHCRDYPEAIEHCQLAVKLDPRLDDPILRHYLAMAFYNEHLYLQAKAEFEGLLKSDPQSQLVANIYQHLANIGKVIREKQKVPEETRLWYWQKGAGLYRAKDYAGARNHLQEVLLMDPGHLESRLLLASCYNHLGDYMKTTTLLAGIEDAEAEHQAAFAWYNLGEFGKAAGLMEKVFRKKKKAEAALYCGRSLAMLARPSEAASWLRLAAEAAPELASQCNIEIAALRLEAAPAQPVQRGGP